MNIKSILAKLVLLAAILFAGCSFVKSREAAEQVVDRHFQMIATNGYAAALEDYGPQFKVPRNDWSKELASLSDKLGAYQSHYIAAWQVLRTNGGFGEGSTVHLQMQVAYTRHNAVENFTIFKAANDYELPDCGTHHPPG